MKQIFISVLLLATASSFAGGESSGGGGAVVCRDAERKIISAELLDLYEGQVRFGYEIPKDTTDPLSYLEYILQVADLNEFYKTRLNELVADVAKRVQLLPVGVGLSAPADLGESYGAVVKDGCSLEGVGYYEEDGTLKISRSVYFAFSATDRAAFFLHEALYKADRLFYGKYVRGSARSRRATAAFFAQAEDRGQLAMNILRSVYEQRYYFTYVINASTFQGPLTLKSVTPNQSYNFFPSAACVDLNSGSGVDLVSAINKPNRKDGNFVVELDPTLNCTMIGIQQGKHDTTMTFSLNNPEEVLYSSRNWVDADGDINSEFWVQWIAIANKAEIPALP